MSTKTKAKAATEEDAPAGGGKKKVLVLVLVVALVAAAAWWFLLRSPAEAAPKPGEVVALDPIQVNLADGHYLSIGIALQGVEGGHEVEGSKALDAVIELFSGRDVAELIKPKSRTELKDELRAEVEHLYHEEVIDVYLTQFVTQ